MKELAMKLRWLLAIVCMLPVLMAASGAAAQDKEKEPSYWMKKKLEYSGQILEGLTSEDFEQIGKNARSMNALGHLEKWVRANSSDYKMQLKIFSSANEQLIEMADAENLDGATLAYVQLTVSCVNCHKIVRGNPRAAPAEPK
jgi:cytochrome c556